MDILKIILAALTGTTVMTIFSYYISDYFNRLFKEPVLLNLIIDSLGAELVSIQKNALGWMIHYIVGLIFVIVYDLIWTYTDIDPTWFCGVIFGIISGIIGIFSWIVLFQLSPNPPRIHFMRYYIQLFIAHIVFALTVVAVYSFFSSYNS